MMFDASAIFLREFIRYVFSSAVVDEEQDSNNLNFESLKVFFRCSIYFTNITFRTFILRALLQGILLFPVIFSLEQDLLFIQMLETGG